MGEVWTAGSPAGLRVGEACVGTHHAGRHHLPHLCRLHVGNHNHPAVPHLLNGHKLDQARDDLRGKQPGARSHHAALHSLLGQALTVRAPALMGVTRMQQLQPLQAGVI